MHAYTVGTLPFIGKYRPLVFHFGINAMHGYAKHACYVRLSILKSYILITRSYPRVNERKLTLAALAPSDPFAPGAPLGP
jgi:hypothetical protein